MSKKSCSIKISIRQLRISLGPFLYFSFFFLLDIFSKYSDNNSEKDLKSSTQIILVKQTLWQSCFSKERNVPLIALEFMYPFLKENYNQVKFMQAHLNDLPRAQKQSQHKLS